MKKLKIDNLVEAFEEMYDFIMCLPSGSDGIESDLDKALEELADLQEAMESETDK